MRQVILDTETTGLNPATGDRIIEIGCVEMVGRRLTDRTFGLAWRLCSIYSLAKTEAIWLWQRASLQRS